MQYYGLMLSCFIFSDIIWLVRIVKASKRTQHFSTSEKKYSISHIMAFLTGLIWFVFENYTFGTVLCLLGFVMSEFAASIIFYEHFKDLEIPCE